MPLSRKRRLPLVRESDASGRTLEIYQEIKEALGVPHVNLIFQAYGAHPNVLELLWKLLRPALETTEFFNFSSRIGAEGYTRVHNYFPVPDLSKQISEAHFSVGAQHELARVVDLFHYNNPLLLVTAATLLQAFEDGPSGRRSSSRAAQHTVFL